MTKLTIVTTRTCLFEPLPPLSSMSSAPNDVRTQTARESHSKLSVASCTGAVGKVASVLSGPRNTHTR